MQEILIEIFDKPLGIIIAQLISATRFTIYLSLIAFIGGGLLALIITFLRIYPSKIFNYISFSYWSILPYCKFPEACDFIPAKHENFYILDILMKIS